MIIVIVKDGKVRGISHEDTRDGLPTRAVFEVWGSVKTAER